MNDLAADGELPPRVRLSPRPIGRGLPVPPLIPLVGLVCLLAGLAAGYGLAPEQGSSAAPTATPAVMSPILSEAPWTLPPWDLPQTLSPSELPMATIPPTAPTETLPTGGLSMEQALAALADSGFGASSAVVLSARLVRYGDIQDTVVGSPDDWVWVFVVYGDFGIPMIGPICTVAPATPTPAAATAAIPSATLDSSDEPCTWPFSTAMVILDYHTGEMEEAEVPAPGY